MSSESTVAAGGRVARSDRIRRRQWSAKSWDVGRSSLRGEIPDELAECLGELPQVSLRVTQCLMLQLKSSDSRLQFGEVRARRHSVLSWGL